MAAWMSSGNVVDLITGATHARGLWRATRPGRPPRRAFDPSGRVFVAVPAMA